MFGFLSGFCFFAAYFYASRIARRSHGQRKKYGQNSCTTPKEDDAFLAWFWLALAFYFAYLHK